MPGLEKPDHSLICKEDANAVDYYEPSGYRRIPLTTCQGGRELEYTAGWKPCAGKEKEAAKKHGGIGGVGMLFAVIIPIMAATAVGWWVYRNWDGKFGRIRLGDGVAGFSSGGAGDLFHADSPLVKWPVAAASGLVAVLVALPSVLGALSRAVGSRFGFGDRAGYAYSQPYTTRDSFQRGRTADFEPVEDEGELLGEDSDDEAT